MLFWKILAVVDVIINLGYWSAIWVGSHRMERSDFLLVPAGLLGTVGVIAYAFSLRTASPLVWRLALPIVLASAAWEIAAVVANDRDPNFGTVVGVAIVTLLAGFTSVALYRLGGSEWIGILGV